MSLIETLRKPFAKRYEKLTWLYDVLAVLVGSMFITLCSKISFLLPFTPVPITLQTFGVIMIGMLMGSKRGASAVGLYLLQGALGLPVFAVAGAGLPYMLGPTGGYLFAFIISAFVVGLLAEKDWDKNIILSLVSFAVGTIIIYTFGVLWLSRFIGWDKVFVAGVLPFIPGAILKASLTMWLLPLGWKIFNVLKKSKNNNK